MSNEAAESKPSPLSVRDVTVAYHRKPVLWNVTLDIPSGSLVGLVGPNGAGKSTLLKTIVDMVPRISGEVTVLGRPYRRARQSVAYVPQRESVDWDFPATALDVVLMGTYGQLGWFRRVGKTQRAAAADALRKMEIEHLADRQISQLSGGQQQRTFLARALVQEAELYLMDEPFAAVDAATERAIVTLMRQLQQQGKTIVVVHHDLHTVPEYFDHIVLLNMRLVACGPTAEVFTEEFLQKTYGGKLTLLEEVGEAMRLRDGGS
ncbi:High-affinity zinc uptake system ATP-binding protein ZnuC [Aureliella helgolandensis]|uniref:High-affinity zinc uptake system ATP-binding protein ZnuC n=2 Tax=Aureliella helgolandensis TaxID=2527968 RepID=A0A518G092_9BACT|nr:High-affinity zinc uptake system ATP-binding protein ZnuC [Aureliella helgolandensis]